jgi:alpha-L-fucosidase
VGPRADGSITEEEQAVLQGLGQFLQINGEGIYDTTPWKWFGEGSVNAADGFFMDSDEKAFTSEDFRFTYKDGCVYAFWLRPKGREVTIRTFAAHGRYDFGIEKVELLGGDGPLPMTRDAEGLHVTLPEEAGGDYPLCLRITLL